MKGLLKVISIILSIFVTIADLVEFLFLPALFVLVGVLNAYPWQYYAITIGGFFALVVIIDLIIRLIFMVLKKKYASRFSRKVENIIARFSKDKENLPAEDN